MVHPCWCEALPTMNRIPLLLAGGAASREATALLEASIRVRARAGVIWSTQVNVRKRRYGAQAK